jgi:hypothetical protein
VSVVGLAVCLALAAVGWLAGGPLIVGLLASLAFGSTAAVTLGGSTPLIYAFFAALLVAAVAARRRIWRDLGDVFGSIRPIWVLCSLMIYAVVGAVLLPRLFVGQTSVFVKPPGRMSIVEDSLAPVSGNITQSAYFVLGGLTAIALCVMLLHKDRLDQVRRGFFLWICLHTGMGLIDLMGKLAGAGDVLAPIRTANYAMLTEAEQGGFARIAGAYSEASAFGGVSLSCLAFTYTYWRMTRDPLARWLALTLLALVLLSTSSTAYVGLAVLGLGVFCSIGRSVLTDRVETDELLILALLSFAAFVVVAVSVYDEKVLDPVMRLIDSAILDKSGSKSGQERAYWNIKSLQNFVDTLGLGIGFGSSRASSWPVAVLSQLGFVGSLMMALLLFVIARGLGRLGAYVDPETEAVVGSVRAAALGSVVAGSLVSGTADPGMVFFIALAVIAAARANARRQARSHAAHASIPAELATA